MIAEGPVGSGTTDYAADLETKPHQRLGNLARVAIVFHFVMILVVVTHVNDAIAATRWGRPVLAVVDLYSLVTFSNRNFGFFAPAVSPDWELEVMASASSGEEWAVPLPMPNREIEVKRYSMLGHFSEDDDTMDLFARSWAVYVMNSDPRVVKVDINVRRNRIPSMAEYRDGARVHPTPYYRTTFELD